GTSYRSRVARIGATAASDAPPSKVSATTGPAPGSTSTSTPRHEAGSSVRAGGGWVVAAVGRVVAGAGSVVAGAGSVVAGAGSVGDGAGSGVAGAGSGPVVACPEVVCVVGSDGPGPSAGRHATVTRVRAMAATVASTARTTSLPDPRSASCLPASMPHSGASP